MNAVAAIDFAALRARAPLAELVGRRVKLTRSGKNWTGCCPFHHEKTPSFFIFTDRFHCFACGVHGDVVDFVARTEGIGIGQAAARLAADAGMGGWGSVPADDAERAKRLERLAGREAERDALEAAAIAPGIARARRIAARLRPLANTVAEYYLVEVRGIHRPAGGWPSALGFDPVERALAGVVTDEAGDAVAAHRIFLTPAGRKVDAAEVAARRLINGKRSDGPKSLGALVLGDRDEGPLVVAEGVETGIAVNSATGLDVLVCLGRFSRHMTLPAGRKLIFAIEDDGPAGAAATLAQLSALADMGHDIAVAWPWPERRGDKSDLADVGLAFGAPAVAARIAAAEPLRPLPSSRRSLLPAFYPGPVEPREAALARQKEVIDRTIADGAALAVLRRRMTARRAELLADIAEPSPAEKGAATRQASLEVAGGPIAKPPRALITGVQGSGKTASAVAAAASIRDPLAVWITAPRLDLALEVAADYRRVAQPDSLPVRVVRGRSAPDPARPGQTMCERAAAAGVVAAAGLSVRAKLCPTCPARDRCGYLQQAAAIGTMGGRGVFVMATPYLFLPSPAPAPDLLIVDEDCVMPAIEVTSLALADLAAYAVSGISADSWAGIDAVRVALLASRPLEAMRATGIGRTGIAAMRAAFHARLDQLVPSLDGGMPDDAIIAACDAPDRRRIGGLLRLLSAIGRELEQPRKTFNAITVRGETITISRLRKPHGVKKAAALLLDGTGDPALAGQLFGRRLVHHRVAIERLAHVTGTKGKAYSRQSITGLDRHGQPRSEDRSAEAAKLRADIQAVARQMPGAPLIVASKAALEALELPDDAPQAHFGALRGLNCWDKVRAAVIVGRESVAIDHLEQLARAFLARDPQPFLAAARFATATRMRRMRGGGLEPVKVEVHPDPRVQRVLEQIREAEIVQAVDRLRPLWNRREFALLNHLCIDVTYDRIRGHTELVAGGTPLEKTYLAKGLLPFGARDLHSLMPALFATRKAAERALAKNPLLPNKDPLWTGGVFLYRLQGQRGRSSRALIDLTRHADPRATLEAAFGPLAAFRALEQPTDAIRTPVRPAADPLVPFSPWFASPATSTWRSDRPPDG